jgi:hypothetical protein
MPVLSVTRLRVRSWRYMPGFLLYTFQSRRQLRNSHGFLGGVLANSPGLAFWTTTAWLDEASMKRFRDTGWHKAAMPKLLEWCDEASLARWSQDGPELPDAAATLQRLQTAGRISKVRHPSAAHAAGGTVPDGRPPRPGLPIHP